MRMARKIGNFNWLCIVAVFLSFAFSSCAANANECDALAKFVCKDARFEKIKVIAKVNLLDTLRQHYRVPPELSDCNFTKKLAEFSRVGNTPMKRERAVQTCRQTKDGFDQLLMFVPDR